MHDLKLHNNITSMGELWCVFCECSIGTVLITKWQNFFKVSFYVYDFQYIFVGHIDHAASMGELWGVSCEYSEDRVLITDIFFQFSFTVNNFQYIFADHAGQG